MENSLMNEKLCLGCGKALTQEQLEKRSSAKFCSIECSRRYSTLKNYVRKYDENFLNNKTILGYFLGFWVADGHITSGEKNYGAIYLTSSKKQLIEDIVKATGYTGAIISREPDAFRSSGIHVNFTQYALHYTGAISQYIQSLGYAPGPKTGKEFLPKEVDDEMFPHFLRGFIDGDGSIRKNRDRVKDGYPTYLSVAIGCTNNIFLKSIENRLRKLGIVRGRLHIHSPNPGGYRLVFGHSDSIRICDFIYKNASLKYNEKYKVYLDCKDLVLKKEMQYGTCTVAGCHYLAVSHGLCKLHADAAYHQLHKDDPEVRESGREAVRRYRAAHHDDLLERRRELYAADPEKHRQAVQAYRERNQDKVKDYKQEYRQTHKESINEYKKRYRQEHPELHKEMDHRKYEKNKEKVLAKCKDYYEKNKEKVKARAAAYREKKRKEKLAEQKEAVDAGTPTAKDNV